MSAAHRFTAAWLLTAALASGAVAQQTPAPAAPGPTVSPSQDLEPAVNTSATPIAAQPRPKRPVPPTAAPAPSAKPVAQPPGDQAAGKPKGSVKDRMELDPTQITGNRELPKVLYIVPWKHSDLGDLGGGPANSLLDEVLTPVDRDVFQRESRYYGALKPDEPRPGGRAGVPPAAGASTQDVAAPPARDEK